MCASRNACSHVYYGMGVALLRLSDPLCLCWPKQSNANFSTRWPLKVSADVMKCPLGCEWCESEVSSLRDRFSACGRPAPLACLRAVSLCPCLLPYRLQNDPVTECFFEISSNLRNTSVCSLCIESSSSIASSADTTV